MAFFSGENFFYTNINRTEEMERFIRHMDDSAIVLREPHDVLTMDMIFVEPKLMHDEMVQIKCVYSEDNWEEFYDTLHLVPFSKIISYAEALDSRDFMKAGDLIIGLPNSRNYGITSCDALYVGKVLPAHRYDDNGDWVPDPSGSVYKRRWGDAEITAEVIYSTEGSVGEKHDINALHFIPTKNPVRNLESYSKIFSHVATKEENGALVHGVAYPIESTSLTEDYKVEARIPGFSEPIICDHSNVRLFKKGEF